MLLYQANGQSPIRSQHFITLRADQMFSSKIGCSNWGRNVRIEHGSEGAAENQ